MGNRVYVSNIPWSASKDDISEFFGGSVGGVVEVSLPTDRETGRPRGFAFVAFQSDAQAQSAISRFDGAQMDGRELHVSEAHERKGGGGGERRDERRR